MKEDRPDHSQRLNEIIAEYLEAVETGNSPDREQLLAAHPDVAEELQSFFAEHDQLRAAAASSREEATLAPAAAGEDATLPPQSPVEDATLAPAASTNDTAQIGTRVRYFGDYELLEEIARGGMGVVYKAKQVSLNRIVALKMILAGQLAGEEDVKRFHAEAEAAANLDHPGIVPIYEIGEHEGQHYFSMGYVEGESLADKIKDGPLPPNEAAEYTRKVAEAVAFAHERGVIHRDLKPGNVLIDRNGEPKVTDFGLAKRIEGDSDLTATGQILGTPSYMPPEQASGKVDEITEAADVYSLGAILYCLLVGHPPFQASNAMDTLLQVLEQEPVPPKRLIPSTPLDLQSVCLKCLEKVRTRRYQNSADLSSDLQRFLTGEPTTARPTGIAAHVWRWYWRNLQQVAGSLTLASCALWAFNLAVGLAITFLSTVKDASAPGKWLATLLMSSVVAVLALTAVAIGTKCGLLTLRGHRIGLYGAFVVLGFMSADYVKVTIENLFVTPTDLSSSTNISIVSFVATFAAWFLFCTLTQLFALLSNQPVRGGKRVALNLKSDTRSLLLSGGLAAAGFLLIAVGKLFNTMPAGLGIIGLLCLVGGLLVAFRIAR